MKVVYSQTHCPACDKLKKELKMKDVEFEEVVIGVDIPVDEFRKKYPNVRTVPFVVEE